MSTWTVERVTELKALSAKGLSLTDIGMRMGLSRGTVGGKLHRMGLMDGGPKRHVPASRAGTGRLADKVAARAQREREAAVLREKFTVIEVVDLPPEDSRNAVPLFALKPTSCRWPIGDPRQLESLRFCGAAQRALKPYCERHCRIAYQPTCQAVPT